MTFNDIISLTVNALAQRGTNADLTDVTATAWTADLTGTLGGLAVKLAQLRLQEAHDFDCMKAATQPVYVTGGYPLAATVKRPFALFHKETGGAAQAIRGHPIWPASAADVDRLGLQLHEGHHHHHGGAWFPGGTSALDLHPGETVWWLFGRTIVLGRPGCRDDSAFAGLALWLDSYTLLAPYAAVGDTDWFTTWGPLALAYQAAALANEVGIKDDRAAMFQTKADSYGAALVKLDQQTKVGGQADIIIGAARGYRMRR